jgi:hypothetical protein
VPVNEKKMTDIEKADACVLNKRKLNASGRRFSNGQFQMGDSEWYSNNTALKRLYLPVYMLERDLLLFRGELCCL